MSCSTHLDLDEWDYVFAQRKLYYWEHGADPQESQEIVWKREFFKLERFKWLEQGCPWNGLSAPPPLGWNPRAQLENIGAYFSDVQWQKVLEARAVHEAEQSDPLRLPLQEPSDKHLLQTALFAVVDFLETSGFLFQLKARIQLVILEQIEAHRKYHGEAQILELEELNNPVDLKRMCELYLGFGESLSDVIGAVCWMSEPVHFRNRVQSVIRFLRMEKQDGLPSSASPWVGFLSGPSS
jgi:hypothetical protein